MLQYGPNRPFAQYLIAVVWRFRGTMLTTRPEGQRVSEPKNIDIVELDPMPLGMLKDKMTGRPWAGVGFGYGAEYEVVLVV